MNELYKTVTADICSIALFYLIFLFFSFTISVLVASVAKTIIDYYYLRQIQYLSSLAGISIPVAKKTDDGTKSEN